MPQIWPPEPLHGKPSTMGYLPRLCKLRASSVSTTKTTPQARRTSTCGNRTRSRTRASQTWVNNCMTLRSITRASLLASTKGCYTWHYDKLIKVVVEGGVVVDTEDEAAYDDILRVHAYKRQLP
ncbi:hypothetical protein PIB30_085008 [Stylosanthes scabra]|uniref:Uncharacterized protein n=1 Tax=Stylosanthes scabra TaxID=79078 RepID=A0ABU6RTL6_9FABA|nr:hypothetical protein [Stylosanthes scabra]